MRTPPVRTPDMKAEDWVDQFSRWMDAHPGFVDVVRGKTVRTAGGRTWSAAGRSGKTRPASLTLGHQKVNTGTSGASLTTLATVNIPAATLCQVTKQITVEFWGTTGANTNAKTFQIVAFGDSASGGGSATILNTNFTPSGSGAGTWKLTVRITNADNSLAHAQADLKFSNGTDADQKIRQSYQEDIAYLLTAATGIYMKGQGTSDNDVVCKYYNAILHADPDLGAI